MKLRLLEILPYKPDEQKNRKLMFESAFITYRALKKINSENFFDVWRINIMCDEVDCDNNIIEQEGILNVHVEFDTRYFSMTYNEKVRYLINLLKAGLTRVFEFKGWDMEIVQNVISDIPADIRENIWYPKLRCSANGYRAKVKCIHSMYDAKIIIEVFQGRKLIKESLPYITYPEIYHLTYTMGRLAYNEDDKTFALYSSINDSTITSVKV